MSYTQTNINDLVPYDSGVDPSVTELVIAVMHSTWAEPKKAAYIYEPPSIPAGSLDEAGILSLLGKGSLYSQAEVDALLVGLTEESYTTVEKAKLALIKANPYQINLPAGDLTTKIAGASFVPVAWATIAMDGTTNAMITHALTGRKVSFVNVFEIDGSDESLLSFDKGTAYTGIKGNGATVLISGIAPTTLPVRIELIFD